MAAASQGVWADGDTVVVLPSGDLPDRCFKCNQPADGYRLAKTLYWHTPWLYLLIVAGVLVYAVVAVVTRTKADVAIPLCTVHKRRRRILIAVAFASLLASIGAVILGYGWVVLGLFVASVVLGLVVGHTVFARRIDNQYVRLGGARAAFLESLPQLE